MCVNLLIVILEIIALVLSIIAQGVENFVFYTQDSNYFAMVVSLLFCVYAVKEMCGKTEIPKWIYCMRYISVSCLMLTALVVVFVLMPMMRENAFSMLYEGSMLYQHTLCPILSIVSFFMFEVKYNLSKTEIIKALIPTIIYAAVAIILNIVKVIKGPYPFLMVYSQPWYASVLWCIAILGIAGVIASVVRSINNSIYRRQRVLLSDKNNEINNNL